MAVSQCEAGRLIRARKEFKTGNVFATHVNGIYAVFSYSLHFPLAVYVPGLGWFVNTDRYSMSTSCQQSKTGVRTLPNCEFVDTQQLQRILMTGTPEYTAQQTLNRVTRRLMETKHEDRQPQPA